MTCGEFPAISSIQGRKFVLYAPVFETVLPSAYQVTILKVE